MDSLIQTSKTTIIPVILKGPNYLLWSRTIKTTICGKGLWNHILEEKSVIEDPKNKKDETLVQEEAKWFQEDQLVLGYLQNSLESSILEAYSYCESAKNLWDTLKRVYGDTSNLSRVFEVKKNINDLRQEDMEFKTFLGRFQSLWAELDMLRPSSVDPKILNERREQDKVFGLLLNLHPNFNDVIKHILREERLPTFEDVCSRIQKEQGAMGLFGRKEELATANKSTLNPGEKIVVCENCKMKGHVKKNCWFLHPHLRPRRSKNPTASSAQEDTATQAGERALQASTDYVKKSDIEAIVKNYASKLNGINLFSHKPSQSLVVDSGASHHMISNPKLLNNIVPALGKVTIANGDGIPIEGTGQLRLFTKESEALFVPEFKSNLVSVKRVTKDLNCKVIFGPNDVCFQDIKNGEIFGKGETKDDLYILQDTSPRNSDSLAFKSCYSQENNSGLWHARLGHPHSRVLEIILPRISFDHSTCEACILGRHCRVVFPKSSTIYEHCFDLVHSDVWTAPCPSRDRNKYFVTFIDEKSKYTWVTLLPSKDRVYEAFLNFHHYVTNQYNAKIKIFRSDNGGEYMSSRFKEHLANHGILHQTSCPHTPQQNGVAERKNRHLMEVARSMMFYANVPKHFWGDAVLAACYLINRIPTKVLQDVSPFEVLTKTKPSLNHLRVFGCVCFVHIPSEQRNKLEATSTRCMFIGYSTTQKGYKCYDPINNRTYVSRDVKFLEDKGYYDKKDWEGLKDLSGSPSDLATSLRFILDHLGNDNPGKTQQGETTTSRGAQDTQEDEPETTTQVQTLTQEQGIPHHQNEVVLEEEEQEEEVIVEETIQPIQQLRRSTRPSNPPERYDGRAYYNNQAVAHPIQAVYSPNLLPSSHQAFLGKIEQEQIPKTYEEAKETKEWMDAVEEEKGAMERNHTWDIEELPRGKKAVSSKWVFTIKYRSNGDIERYKARLVARGFTQTYVEDYTDTFSSVRVVLSLATNLS